VAAVGCTTGRPRRSVSFCSHLNAMDDEGLDMNGGLHISQDEKLLIAESNLIL
jgi:hypothetical protein